MKAVSTTPFEGQKPGTSGLRKKTSVFMQPHYVENFVQATFDAVGSEQLEGRTIVVGGDGRYFNKEMTQVIVKMAAANGLSKVVIGQNGLLSTPAVSCLIRRYSKVEKEVIGGFILTASHNPGGLKNDCGLKYNIDNGGPAPESITSKIFENTKTISEYKICSELPDVALDTVGVTKLTDGFTVEVVDSTAAYVALMKEVFDMALIKSLTERAEFKLVYDAMHGVAGPYAKAIFCKELQIPESQLMNCEPSEDFNGGHPDPNLTYAPELVKCMGLDNTGRKLDGVNAETVPDFGAAADGDADRNMILGKQFFVTPSDSLAVIAANADKCIPFFKDHGGVKAVARSMPTSAAVDIVAKDSGKQLFEVPTGWKFFGNLMDSKDVFDGDDFNPLICGEESFGTGSNHVREKDGIWAVLCWLSIVAYKSKVEGKVVSVEQIVRQHWQKYGRNFYCRYDYEGVESAAAAAMMKALSEKISSFEKPVELKTGYLLVACDIFEYKDPVDSSVSSNQGWMFNFSDGSRFVFRLSGTGSVGATIRLYLEKYEEKQEKLGNSTSDALSELVDIALEYSRLEHFTGRKAPTVIT